MACAVNAMFPHFNQQYIMQIDVKELRKHFNERARVTGKNLSSKKGRKSETGQTQLAFPARTTTSNKHCISRLQLSSY